MNGFCFSFLGFLGIGFLIHFSELGLLDRCQLTEENRDKPNQNGTVNTQKY